MTKLKQVIYKGCSINFEKRIRFKTSFGYAGSDKVIAKMGNLNLSEGVSKSDALKLAKKEIDRIQSRVLAKAKLKR